MLEEEGTERIAGVGTEAAAEEGIEPEAEADQAVLY
jgi:hypothetical protein